MLCKMIIIKIIRSHTFVQPYHVIFVGSSGRLINTVVKKKMLTMSAGVIRRSQFDERYAFSGAKLQSLGNNLFPEYFVRVSLLW